VRSFAERKLGPRDSGENPLGGEFYTVFNAELTFPVYGALQGAVFTDAGMPIGPLRLDYGLNPDPQEGEDTGAFHFSFGFAF
jgi:outer membrane protein assembly factor BamA